MVLTRYKNTKNVLLSALSINIHIAGGDEQSKYYVAFLSLRIRNPLAVNSEASTTARFHRFQANNLPFLHIPKSTVQFVCCLNRTACASIINDIKPANFAITFCNQKVGHVYMSNKRGAHKRVIYFIYMDQNFLFSVTTPTRKNKK